MKPPPHDGDKRGKSGSRPGSSASFASETPNSKTRRSSNPSSPLGTAPSTPNAIGAHSSRRNSDSASQQHNRSNETDSISRFPFHGNRTRSRSADTASHEGSVEVGELDSPSSAESSPLNSGGAGGLDQSLGDHNSLHLGLYPNPHRHHHNHLDDSAASTLMLQESATFPDMEAENQANCYNFAMEHRIFLKAILELLAQRDKVATEVGMNDPNVFKSGPLKKASHLMRGIWKVKYVEIRRGMFSYYEDNVSYNRQNSLERGGSGVGVSGTAESLLRKNIPLEANSCHCRAVRLHQKAWNITPRGAIFELSIAGKPKRLWMANSREERQAWIQAINDAMVGGSATRGGNKGQKSSTKAGGIDSRSPHKNDLKKYLKAQSNLRSSKTKDDYVIALRHVYRHDLNVPVKHIIKQAEQESKGNNSNSDVKGAFHEEDVKFGVDQLFKDLLRDTVKINDHVYQGNSGHAPERITGALARLILLHGRLDREEELDGQSGPRTASKYDMSESQALAYARDVLLSGNRTRSGGDSYFCVNALCKNDELVVVVPSSAQAEPVSITVAQDDDNDSGFSSHDMHAKDGWLRTRRRSKKSSWMKAYFVLSEGTLSFYEHALPRPHGLQGQMPILEATISVSREEQKGNTNGEKSSYFVLTIVARDKSERQILFETEEKLLVWAYALECSAKAKGGAAPAPLLKAMNSMIRRMPRVSVAGGVGISNHKVPLDDNSTKLEVTTSLAEAALKEHVANLGLDFGALEKRLVAYASQSSTVVKVSIEAGTVYKICTLDPQGEESEDTWAVVDATFLQEFRVSGGTNGRILRGEEIVRVDVTKCSPAPISARRTSSLTDRSGSPSSPNRRMQKLYRTFSDEVVRKPKT